MKNCVFIFLTMILLAGVQSAVAELPATLSYQGLLKTGEDTIVPDGDYAITFRIYDQPADGAALWTELQTLPVSHGIFSAILGSVADLDLPFDSPYWLSVQVGSEDELAPRVELTASAYAFRAVVADSIAGLDELADDDWVIDGDDIYRLNGSIGVGTDSPTSPLTFLPINGTEIEFLSGTGFNADIKASGSFNIGTSSSSSLNLMTNNMYRLSITGTGLVGIGTTSPTELLDVAGTTKTENFMMPTAAVDGYVLTADASGLGTWQPAPGGDDGDWAILGGNVYRLHGNVGIGTSAPNRALHIYENVNGITGIRIENPNTGSSSIEAITFRNEDGDLASISVYDDDSVYASSMRIANNRPGGDIELFTGAQSRLFVAESGNVGIGISNPSHKLHVTGTARMSGFMLSTAPAAGYVLTSDATGVGTWQAAPGGGFSLPYAGSVNYSGNAFSVTNTGAGTAGHFECDNASNNNAGVWAKHNGTGPAIYGRHEGNGPAGVFWAYSAGNTRPAVEARSWGSGAAVKAEASGSGLAGEFIGNVDVDGSLDVSAALSTLIHAEYTGVVATDAIAVHGESVSENVGGYGIGGKFEGGSRGVEAEVYPPDPATDFYYGVLSTVDGGQGYNTGVSGWAMGDGENFGIFGKASGTGVNLAGLFDGDVDVTGTLSKGGGSFKIDHPLDPENKYLYHSFVESPDMMNVYNGNSVLDAAGEAWIELPDWFEALNGEFRYQLTCIGGFAPVYIAEEIAGNRFKVAGGTAGLRVSWQVTGIRHDPFAEQNRIPVEEDKPSRARGKYLHPEAYGQSGSASVHYELSQQGTNR